MSSQDLEQQKLGQSDERTVYEVGKLILLINFYA